jgi:hypothetical protein
MRLWRNTLFIIGCVLLAVEVAGSFFETPRPLLALGGMIPLAVLVWFQFEDELTPRRLGAATLALLISAAVLGAAVVGPVLSKSFTGSPRRASTRWNLQGEDAKHLAIRKINNSVFADPESQVFLQFLLRKRSNSIFSALWKNPQFENDRFTTAVQDQSA